MPTQLAVGETPRYLTSSIRVSLRRSGNYADYAPSKHLSFQEKLSCHEQCGAELSVLEWSAFL